MSFRRDGDTQFAKKRDWTTWLSGVSDLVDISGLPKSVLDSEDAWWYLVDRTYSQAGYLGTEPWYSTDSLTAQQSDAFVQLLSRWLKDRWPEAPEHKVRSLEVTYGLPSNRT